MTEIKGLDACVCAHCGKTLLPVFEKKWLLGPGNVVSYPPEQYPDTLAAVCECGSALCYSCYWDNGVNQCPGCHLKMEVYVGHLDAAFNKAAHEGKTNSNSLYDECSGLLSSENAIRMQTADRLSALHDPRTVPYLVQALRDCGMEAFGRNGDVAAAAYSALVGLGDVSIDPVVHLLQSPAWPVRVRAIHILQVIGNPRVIPVLIPMLKDSAMYGRSNAAKTLELMGWTPPDDETRALVWIATGQVEKCTGLGAAAVPALIDLLYFLDEDVRGMVRKTLMAIGEPAVEPLIHVLAHQKGIAQEAAALTLAEIHDRRAVLPLMEALRVCEHWRTVGALALALGELKDRRALDVLSEVADRPYCTVTRYMHDGLDYEDHDPANPYVDFEIAKQCIASVILLLSA